MKFWALRPSEWCGTCRSRQALSNGTLVAKIGVDTAENEPIKKLEIGGPGAFFLSLGPRLADDGRLLLEIPRGLAWLWPKVQILETLFSRKWQQILQKFSKTPGNFTKSTGFGYYLSFPAIPAKFRAIFSKKYTILLQFQQGFQNIWKNHQNMNICKILKRSKTEILGSLDFRMVWNL